MPRSVHPLVESDWWSASIVNFCGQFPRDYQKAYSDALYDASVRGIDAPSPLTVCRVIVPKAVPIILTGVGMTLKLSQEKKKGEQEEKKAEAARIQQLTEESNFLGSPLEDEPFVLIDDDDAPIPRGGVRYDDSISVRSFSSTFSLIPNELCVVESARCGVVQNGKPAKEIKPTVRTCNPY
jgi:hypothetical protein